MATQIVARLTGPEWIKPLEVYENRAGQIVGVQGSTDPELSIRLLGAAYGRLLSALQRHELVAEVEVKGRRLTVPGTYWATGSGLTGVRQGKIVFNGAAPSGLKPLEGRHFFVSRDLFVQWLDTAAPAKSHVFAHPPRESKTSSGYGNPTLLKAIQQARKSVGEPGATVMWKTFCHEVRRISGATENTRGYGDKTIQRVVTGERRN
jgi:hypothetical protein